MPRSPRLRLRRAPLLVALVAIAAGLSACGPAAMVNGTDEGSYLKAGPLVYQVQLSRELNPSSVEDRAYLADLPASERALSPSQEWFAVFVRVTNPGDQPATSASRFEIHDTLGKVYRPVVLFNQYAYKAQAVAPGAQLPTVDSTPYYAPTAGALLLFKVNRSIYQNRPLDLLIHSPGFPSQSQTAMVELDL